MNTAHSLFNSNPASRNKYGIKKQPGNPTARDPHYSSHLWKVEWDMCRYNHSRTGGHRDGVGTSGVLLIPGWAGKALPILRDIQQGSLPTLPNSEQIWAGFKRNGERVTLERPHPDVSATNAAGSSHVWV